MSPTERISPAVTAAAALSWALRGVIHDLNGAVAPLATFGFDIVSGPDDAREVGEGVVEVSHRLADRVAQLRVLVRLDDPPARLDEVLTRVLRIVESPLRRAALVRTTPSEPVLVTIDGHLVAQALLVLLYGIAGERSDPPRPLVITLERDGDVARLRLDGECTARGRLDSAAAHARELLGERARVEVSGASPAAQIDVTLPRPAAP